MIRLDNITELKSFILKTVKETLNESFPKGFDFNKFISLPTLKEKFQYAIQMLGATKYELGEGSSRLVFRMDSKKALKLAKGNKGLAQNKEEKEFTNMFPEITPAIFKSADDNTWLLSELAKPLTEEGEFHSLAGFSWPLFAGMLFNIDKKGSIQEAINSLPNNPEGYGYPAGTNLKEEAMKMIRKPLFKKIIQAVGAGLLVKDIIRLEQWGKSADGRLVLVDAGFTDTSSGSYQ